MKVFNINGTTLSLALFIDVTNSKLVSPSICSPNSKSFHMLIFGMMHFLMLPGQGMIYSYQLSDSIREGNLRIKFVISSIKPSLAIMVYGNVI